MQVLRSSNQLVPDLEEQKRTKYTLSSLNATLVSYPISVILLLVLYYRIDVRVWITVGARALLEACYRTDGGSTRLPGDPNWPRKWKQ